MRLILLGLYLLSIAISSSIQLKVCRNVAYDPNSQICCGESRLYRVLPGHVCCKDSYVMKRECRFRQSLMVCGSRFYNPTTSICCQSKISSRSEGKDDCCIHVSYNAITHFCHMTGLIHEKNDCTSSTTLPYSYICCNGKRYLRNSRYSCCRSSYLPSYRCKPSPVCGRHSYDARIYDCCDNKLYSKIRGHRCCHSVYMSSSICARMTVYCEGRRYDNALYICCEDNIYHKLSNKRCCSTEYYSVEYHHCSRGVVVPHCINNAATLCCDGVAYNRIPNLECCSSRTYDNRRYYCFRANIEPKKVCGHTFYNPSKSVCCRKHLLFELKSDHACCRYKYYNYDTSYCNAGVVVPR